MPYFDSEYLQGLTPIEFEHLVSELLIAMGFDACTTKTTGDGGVDIIAISEEPIIRGKYVIQCKRYAKGNNIAEPLVRELFGVMHSQNANKGILITTSEFTKAATLFAQDKAIELINGDLLVHLLNKYLAHSHDGYNVTQDRQNDRFLKHLQQFERDIEFLLKREERRSEYSSKKGYSDSDEYFYRISSHLSYDGDILKQYGIKTPTVGEKFENIKTFVASSFDSTVYDILYSMNTKEELDVAKADPDFKVLLSFIEEYSNKTLETYREFLELTPPKNENVRAYHVSCISQLKEIFIILKAIDEAMKYYNPLLLNLVLDHLDNYLKNGPRF